MEKFWLKNYPSTISEEISIEHESIHQNFDQKLAHFKKKIAFENYGQTLSFERWQKLSFQFASYLQNHCHLKKGDRIAIQVPNILQTPIAVIGALRAGLTVVNINPLYTVREMREVLEDSQPRAMVIFSHSAHKLSKIIKDCPIEHIIVADLVDMFSPLKKMIFYVVTHYIKKMVQPYHFRHVHFNQCLKIGEFLPFKDPMTQKTDLAFLQYTGGTTGRSKGAMLTHENILSNIEQCQAWMRPFLKKGDEVSITALPLYHIFALTINMFVLPLWGTYSILITNPRDTRNFIKLLKNKKKWSVFVGVNSLFKLLLNQPQFKDLDFSSLRCCIAGGASVEESVYDRWLKTTKCPIVEGYGLTEASPVVSCNLLDHPKKKTCGLPLPSTNIRITNLQNQILKEGEEGEIEVQGPQVMQGYWNSQNETKQIITSDGWLKTGDIGTIDVAGYLRILDRKKDMILVSGFNVYPNEIEDVIAAHPKVKNAAVVGVSDPHSGEAPQAFISTQNSDLTEEEIRSYCKKHLAAYKVPKYIVFKEQLPHSYVGKILRRKLRKTPASNNETS